MTDADDVRRDFQSLLAAVEAAPPVEAIDVLDGHKNARQTIADSTADR